jgi:hypothetical protein
MRAPRGHATIEPLSTFRITGLDPESFRDLVGKSDAELAALGARRCVVDASSPYRSSHAVFVREGATIAYDAIDEIPEVLRRRLLSVRAFDRDAMMVAADVIDGSALREWIASTFDNVAVDFIDLHNAKPGCFAARVRRA